MVSDITTDSGGLPPEHLDDDEEVAPTVPLLGVPPKKQKTMSALSSLGNIPTSTDRGTFAGGSYSMQYRTAGVAAKFSPMHFITYWKDAYHKAHLTTTILLPGSFLRGGVQGKVFPSISECGKELVIKLLWPQIYGDLRLMERGWKREEDITERQIVTMMMSAEEELSGIRSALGIDEHEAMYSEANIKLNVECEREIKKLVPSVDKYGSTVLYVILKVQTKAPVRNNLAMTMRPIDEFTDDDDSSTDTMGDPKPSSTSKWSSDSYKSTRESTREKKTPKSLENFVK